MPLSPTLPSTVLGVYDGTHDAGAALVVDGVLVAACNEERFSRMKGQGGWPERSIQACLATAGLRPESVEEVAVAGLVNPNPGLRLARSLQQRWRLDEQWFYRSAPSLGSRLGDWLQFDSPFPRMRSDGRAARALRPLLTRRLRATLRPVFGDHADRVPLRLHDHHRCHAAGAWHSAPWHSSPTSDGAGPGLIVVADGLGDGLTTTIWQGQGTQLRRLDARPFPDSYGLFFATITGFLGFRPFRHEGKLCGLAAHGDHRAVTVPFPFEGPSRARRFTQRFGMPLRPWLAQLSAFRPEDVCAWLQHNVELDLSATVSAWLQQTGLRRLALAGGVFANVHLNQRLAAVSGLDELWVFPHMGDGGLAMGAALDVGRQGAREALGPGLTHAFLGPAWSDDALLPAIETAVVEHSDRLQQVQGGATPQAIAQHLADGQLVARYAGAMEVGPRALGHRSILAATDADTPDRLNACLRRSDFMPFAPLLLADDAQDWTQGLDTVQHSARFMTVGVQATAELARLCPAVVHVDGSLRPQLVAPDDDSGLFEILSHYRRLTGRPALINTSFNMHEEPIVCSPQQAITAFLASGLHALALGPFLLTRCSSTAGAQR